MSLSRPLYVAVSQKAFGYYLQPGTGQAGLGSGRGSPDLGSGRVHPAVCSALPHTRAPRYPPLSSVNQESDTG